MTEQLLPLTELKKKFDESSPSNWEQLPDFSLYMDQVISYMPRQVLALEGEEKLTSAMVNNYIKEGLLPRAQGKRYTKEHIAYLTAICVLKQVLSVKELAQILPGIEENTDVEGFYSRLLEVLHDETAKTGELININEYDENQLTELALQLAVSAYCRQFLCKKIIETLAAHNEPNTENKKEAKEKK